MRSSPACTKALREGIARHLFAVAFGARPGDAGDSQRREADQPKAVVVAVSPAAVEQHAKSRCRCRRKPNYQRYDHRGALGLLLATTVERKDTGGAGALADSGWRSGLELGGTYPVSYSGNEFKVALSRAARRAGRRQRALPRLSRLLRSLVLEERARSVEDVLRSRSLRHITPAWSVSHVDGLANPLSAPHALSAGVTVTGGPRVGVGVQLDFLPVSGAYFAIAGQLGFGTGVRFGAEALFGFQLRSYLLE